MVQGTTVRNVTTREGAASGNPKVKIVRTHRLTLAFGLAPAGTRASKIVYYLAANPVPCTVSENAQNRPATGRGYVFLVSDGRGLRADSRAVPPWDCRRMSGMSCGDGTPVDLPCPWVSVEKGDY